MQCKQFCLHLTDEVTRKRRECTLPKVSQETASDLRLGASVLPALDSDQQANHLPVFHFKFKIQPPPHQISPPLYSVLFLQSLRSISAVPAMTSSSSLASKTDTSLASTTYGIKRTRYGLRTERNLSYNKASSEKEGIRSFGNTLDILCVGTLKTIKLSTSIRYFQYKVDEIFLNIVFTL